MNNYYKYFQKWKGGDIIFFIFLVVYSVGLIYLCNKLNIWEDEAYSLNTTSNKLFGVISESYNFEGQPPFYFIILALWRLINSGIFFARLLSIVFIGLAAYVFYRLVRLISGPAVSNWLVVIFLLNPFTVWAALEIRAYALLIFLSTISIYFFIRYIFFDKKRDLYYFLILCLAGIYTQYFFVFLIAALSFSLLVIKGWRAFFLLCLYLLPVVFLSLPNLWFLADNISMARSDNRGYSLVQRLTLVLYSTENLLFALNSRPFDRMVYWGFRIVSILLGTYAYYRLYTSYRLQKKSHFEKINFLMVTGAILVIMFVIYLVLSGIKFNDRYMSVAFPLLLFMFVIFKEFSFFYRLIIFSSLSIFFIVLLSLKYMNPVKTYDYPSLAQYIKNTKQPFESILFNSRTISLPFEYYYEGNNNIIQLPITCKLTENAFQRIIKDTSQLNQLISSVSSPSESLLFVNDLMIGYSCDFKFTTGQLDEYLNSHYQITLDTLFFGKSTTTYSLRIRRLLLSRK